MEEIHYVYLTTNLVNDKQYVGDRTENEITRKRKYYQGSGKYFLSAVKKYGEHNFFKEILEWFDTREEAFNAQEKYIILYNTLQPNGYNISPKGGHNVIGSLSEETKQKISKSLIGENNPNYGKSAWNKGKKSSDETKKKLSESHKGQKSWNKGKSGLYYTSEETRKKQSESLKGKPKPHRGHKISEETKIKLRESNIGKKRSEETKMKMRKPRSEEAKNNISSSKKGLISSFKGKNHTMESKEKMKKNMKGRIPWNKGKNE